MKDELKLGSTILAGCCFMWFYAIPNHIKGTRAALYPKGLIIAMMIISVLMLIKGILLKKTGEKEKNWTFINEATARSLMVVPIMVVYIFLIDIIGFYVMTFSFIIIFMIYFGARKPLSICLFSTILPLVVYLIIGRILSFPFPAGFLF